MQPGEVAGDFSLLEGFSSESLHAADFVITEGGDMENDADVFAFVFLMKEGVQVGVRRKRAQPQGAAFRVAVGGAGALETEDFPAVFKKRFRQTHAEFAGGKVSDAPYGVDVRQAWAAGDNCEGRSGHGNWNGVVNLTEESGGFGPWCYWVRFSSLSRL